MSLDQSLKRKSSLVRARNVLKRHERVEQLKSEDRFGEGDSPLGLPKVRVRRSLPTKKKKPAKTEEK